MQIICTGLDIPHEDTEVICVHLQSICTGLKIPRVDTQVTILHVQSISTFHRDEYSSSGHSYNRYPRAEHLLRAG